MTEEIKPQEETQEAPKSVYLQIEFTNEGKINVNGPIANEMLCYFLLEKAKDIIKGHNLRLIMEEKSKVVKPSGGIMNFARNLRR